MLLKHELCSIFHGESNETKNEEVALTAKELKGVKVEKIQNFIKKLITSVTL